MSSSTRRNARTSTPIRPPKNVLLNSVSGYIRESFFRVYTFKQKGLDLPKLACGDAAHHLLRPDQRVRRPALQQLALRAQASEGRTEPSAGGHLNHPKDHSNTRVTEFKYLTGNEHDSTLIARETPSAGGDAHFSDRLALHGYYNTDSVAGAALGPATLGKGAPVLA